MSEWAKVKWTDAGQITRLMGGDAAASGDQSAPPKGYFDALVAAKNHTAAVNFIALALPRLEAVAWGAEVLKDAPESVRTGADRATLSAVERWLADPDDGQRRAAWAQAETLEIASAEKLLATAAFLSGGSMAPEELAAIQPEPHLCGKLAAAAVLSHAYRSEDPAAVLSGALRLGDTLASQGAG